MSNCTCDNKRKTVSGHDKTCPKHIAFKQRGGFCMKKPKQQTEKEYWKEDADRLNNLTQVMKRTKGVDGKLVGAIPVLPGPPPELNDDGSYKDEPKKGKLENKLTKTHKRKK